MQGEVRGLVQKVKRVAVAQGGGKVEEVKSMVVDLNESMKSYGTQMEEKIAQLGNHQKGKCRNENLWVSS